MYPTFLRCHAYGCNYCISCILNQIFIWFLVFCGEKSVWFPSRDGAFVNFIKFKIERCREKWPPPFKHNASSQISGEHWSTCFVRNQSQGLFENLTEDSFVITAFAVFQRNCYFFVWIRTLWDTNQFCQLYISTTIPDKRVPIRSYLIHKENLVISNENWALFPYMDMDFNSITPDSWFSPNSVAIIADSLIRISKAQRKSRNQINPNPWVVWFQSATDRETQFFI